MKKLVAFLMIAGMLAFGVNNSLSAQTDTAAKAADTTTQVAPAAAAAAPAPAAEQQSFHQVLKQKFIEGGAEWMAPILIVMIIGLALVVERIIYLNLSSTNTTKLLNKV
ncbi:MAG TPA: MotA/TolQ/ExbB proton channel family protein, partial [Bacteroidales bacterium]|nr:MotA/TolQ/ExbB proton channel family protein [Bacteroidales bacterium]